MNMRKIRAGLFFGLVGLVLGIVSINTMTFGTPARMGPGFFPVVLCAFLLVFAVVIIVQGLLPGEWSAVQYAPLRSIALVTLAPIAFGLLVRPAGMVIALFVTTLLAATARREGRLRTNLLIAAGLTVLCVAVFIYGVGLSVPLFPGL